MELKSQTPESRQPARSAKPAIDGDQTGATQADILDTLKKEHEAVKKLLASLEDSDSVEERHRLVKKIASELVPHSVAEEKVVYNMVIALPDRAAQVDGYEGTLEHEWASKTLERLTAIQDANSTEHKATAKVLKELVEHHIREEEENIWRDVRKHCSHDDRARINALYIAEKRRVKLPDTR